jgi:predicted metal-dependent hydrolase
LDDAWESSPAYLRGIELFNAGYYWEAHEAWESLWHAHGRRGPTAEALQALIKLAAAGVKVREGRPAGVQTHAARAAALFDRACEAGGRNQLGLDLEEWADRAWSLADHPPVDPAPAGMAVSRVFEFAIEPSEEG